MSEDSIRDHGATERRILEIVTECGGECDSEAAYYIAKNLGAGLEAALSQCAALREALTWLRRHARLVDHDPDCPRRQFIAGADIHLHCTCGYEDATARFGSIDEVLAATAGASEEWARRLRREAQQDGLDAAAAICVLYARSDARTSQMRRQVAYACARRIQPAAEKDWERSTDRELKDHVARVRESDAALSPSPPQEPE